MKTHLLLVMFLIACDGGSGNANQPDAAMPDASPDAPEPTNVVEVATFGDMPLFIRYREGTGPWKTPTETSSGYELLIHEQYELVAVCASGDGFEIGYEANTLAEGNGSTFLPCFSFTDTQGSPVIVTGTMAQPGTVMLGDAQDTSATGNWSFELAVDVGLHDLIAVGNARVAIRRNLDINGPTTLESIDVVAAGSALTALPLTVNGLDGDLVQTSSYFLTSKSFANLTNETGTVARLVPMALVNVTDFQFAVVNAESGDTFRNAFVQYKNAATTTTFTLLPKLAGVQFGPNSVSWSQLPDGGRELFVISGANALRAYATQSALGTRTTLAVDLDIPGFREEWKLGAPEYQTFEVNASADDVSLGTGVQQLASALRPPPGIDRMARMRLKRSDAGRGRR